MIKQLPINQFLVAKKVWTIQKQAYKKEAEWLEIHDFPPLNQTVDNLMKSSEKFWGYYEQGTLVGVVSIENHHDHIQISRVVVNPVYFNQGIGSRLLEFIIHHYNENNIVVHTGKKNDVALKLYNKYGFFVNKEWTVENDLTLVQLVRPVNR